jgi:hypothetical protein
VNFIKRELARNLKIESEIPVLTVCIEGGWKQATLHGFPADKRSDDKRRKQGAITRNKSGKIKGSQDIHREDGCHRLKTREGDEKHTAFITEYWLYEWTTMCSAYAAYQQNSEES